MFLFSVLSLDEVDRRNFTLLSRPARVEYFYCLGDAGQRLLVYSLLHVGTDGVGGFIVFDHIEPLDLMRRMDTKQFDCLNQL